MFGVSYASANEPKRLLSLSIFRIDDGAKITHFKHAREGRAISGQSRAVVRGVGIWMWPSRSARLPRFAGSEVDAAKTGDWSTVEDRARMNEKMSVAPKLKCPEHLILMCIKDGAHEDCSCVPPH